VNTLRTGFRFRFLLNGHFKQQNDGITEKEEQEEPIQTKRGNLGVYTDTNHHKTKYLGKNMVESKIYALHAVKEYGAMEI
jgi:hypothetical protein